MTVFLDQTAVFECEVDSSDFSGWKVNGTSFNRLDETLPELVDDVDSDPNPTAEGTVELTLTITGRAEYSGLTVQCFVGDFEGNSDESDIVTINVQGITLPAVLSCIFIFTCFTNYFYVGLALTIV